jgi:hypothetical protein
MMNSSPTRNVGDRLNEDTMVVTTHTPSGPPYLFLFPARRHRARPRSRALPELKPWCEVGWIFRDGDCIAIERKGEETRSRVLVD